NPTGTATGATTGITRPPTINPWASINAGYYASTGLSIPSFGYYQAQATQPSGVPGAPANPTYTTLPYGSPNPFTPSYLNPATAINSPLPIVSVSGPSTVTPGVATTGTTTAGTPVTTSAVLPGTIQAIPGTNLSPGVTTFPTVTFPSGM